MQLFRYYMLSCVASKVLKCWSCVKGSCCMVQSMNAQLFAFSLLLERWSISCFFQPWFFLIAPKMFLWKCMKRYLTDFDLVSCIYSSQKFKNVKMGLVLWQLAAFLSQVHNSVSNTLKRDGDIWQSDLVSLTVNHIGLERKECHRFLILENPIGLRNSRHNP